MRIRVLVANEIVHPPGPLQPRGVVRNRNAAPVGVQRLVRPIHLQPPRISHQLLLGDTTTCRGGDLRRQAVAIDNQLAGQQSDFSVFCWFGIRPSRMLIHPANGLAEHYVTHGHKSAEKQCGWHPQMWHDIAWDEAVDRETDGGCQHKPPNDDCGHAIRKAEHEKPYPVRLCCDVRHKCSPRR